MDGCPQCGTAMDPGEAICPACGRDRGLAHDDTAPARTRTEGPAADREAQDMLAAVRQVAAADPVLVTTTPGVEGRRIVRYLGIVTGEAIMGAHVFKDLFAGLDDVVGGRVAGYEQELVRGRELALRQVRDRAARLGANAVVGVHLDYEALGQSMLMVAASGTAVLVG
jgi:uncharacterized protein YbjQ (UPF0145 family)